MRSISSRTVDCRKHLLVAGVALALWLAGAPAALRAHVSQPGGFAAASNERVLTSFEQIWALSAAEQQEWHRVKLDYLVYFYDPLWMALWGRCGDADSYLSLGTKVFPIKPGQRIRVEGRLQPSRGMRVDDAAVTVLEEAVELDVLSTEGQVASTERFNKRLVTLEGLVDRQVVRDANHLELYVVAEGRTVLGQLVLKNDVPTPQLKGALVRLRGVYFARAEPEWAGPKIELWIQGPEDVAVLGTLERDPRFAAPAWPLAELAKAGPDQQVHIVGTVKVQDPGQTVTLGDGNAEVVVHTPQTLTLRPDEPVEAIGWPAQESGGWVLRRALLREVQTVYTTAAQLWGLSEAEKQKWHRVRMEVLVYYFDADWKVLWGRVGESDEYLSLGSRKFPLKPGQRILLEGLIRPADGMIVEEPRVTILKEGLPLVPQDTRGQIGNTGRFDKRWVVVEGYFDRQLQRGATHVDIDLLVDGRPLMCRLLVPEETQVPDWQGCRLRVQGVYSATQDPAGGLPSLELWTPGPEFVAVIGSLDTDPRFEVPATQIDQLSKVSPGTQVRVAGAVRAQQPGKLLTIRDPTGQLTLHTPQLRPVRLGEQVEAIGYPRVDGLQVELENGLFRPSRVAAPAPAAELPQLRLAEQLRELQPEEAERGYPVHLSGIVTWARPNADFFFMTDVSGGVCVYRPTEFAGSMYAGTKIEVSGVSASGRFTPVVLASLVQTSASIDLPEAPLVTLEQALTGVEEANWVSMRGYVRAVAQEGAWLRLEMTTAAGEFQALMPPHDLAAKLPGSVVRVRGVCSAVANEKRQLTGIQLWIPSFRYIDIEDAAPAEPFAFAERSIASLRQFNTLEAPYRRVRVCGTVIHQTPGRLVHIQDDNEGLLVLSRDMAPLAPGDQIEAVGFPGREHSRVVLREAVYRRTAAGPEPRPVAVSSMARISEELEGRLVRVEAQLLDAGSYADGVRLLSQRDQTIFEAVLDAPATVPTAWVSQSRVALTGVYQVIFDEYHRPQVVRLKLRSPRDVEVLRRPSRLSVRSVLAFTGVLAVLIVLGFGWVVALRRRVHHQRDIIQEQVESEKAARLEAALARASKLESLGVLAGGIAHDFNNLLTVIMGNLSLAKLDPRIEPDTVRSLSESERAAARARDLTQQLLTFAKGGEPVRAATRLPDLVREAAEFALHGAKVRCEHHVAPDLWAADVDRGQVSQVVQNIVINAMQAMPGGGQIDIGLQNEELAEPRAGLPAGRYVRLTVADTGAGIAPENLSRIFEPYFTTKSQGTGLGLATVYSIVRRHQGRIEVTSRPGEGTTFTIWLPAATAVPAVERAGPVAPGRPQRVLLMDDDASIRLLGTTVLKRMGCDVTTVSDGAAAVDEYAAARAAGRPYDLVILDLTVPGGMGGMEAMEKLRGMDPQVCAIVSSGYSSDPVMANYQAHGFRGRVPKPYLASDLSAAVAELLEPAG